MGRLLAVALAGWPLAAIASAQEADSGAQQLVEPAVAAAEPTAPQPVVQDRAPEPSVVEAAALAPDGPTLSAAELEALGLQLEGPAIDTELHVSGFADFTAYVPVNMSGAAAAFNASTAKDASFYVGNLNLFITKNLSESFRTMAEVRFSYLPNGNIDFTRAQTEGFNYADTTVGDYADGGHLERWGGIILQRAYLEWMLHPRVSVRMGQYLTPYGIWNVDHGSPAFIPVARPFAIGNNWFPQRQTGFELFGKADLGATTAWGYHATLSNGTGPVSEYRDLDKNKAVGGRVFLEHRGLGYLRIGVSGYFGRDTSSVPRLSIGADGSLDSGTNVLSQSDILALAADVQFKYERFLLQSEWVTQQRAYTRHRPTVTTLAGQGSAVDTLAWAGYVLAGYELPWWALMPYVMLQYDREVYALGAVDAEFLVTHGGVNMHPIDSVVFKVEYVRSFFLLDSIGGDVSVQSLFFQSAWAF